MRRNSAQLDLFGWVPTTQVDRRVACIAAFATASASQVAARHGVRRSAVLSYVYRARQAGLPVASRPSRVPGGKHRSAEFPSVKPVASPAGVRLPTVGTPMPSVRRDPVSIFPVDVPDEMPALLTLGDRECRAIIDETQACCGLPTEGRSSYCRAHRAAYRASARPLRLETL